jgi:asparagine synthase (glutamine-hydrolysing)
VCGIAGIATRGETPDVARIRRMTDVIAHRGPDGEGRFVAPGVGLGMRRLAIIDLATGDQPIGNETGEIQVVFNGEIYNYSELRADLEAKGHVFRTRSDTEVIPHLYEERGLDFAPALNGIFAIALWDARDRSLLLLRDRAGVKPLYWSEHDGALVFGSEVKCLLVADASRREIDPHGLDQLLTFEYTASPTTLLRDVRKLPPGGWLRARAGRIESGCFWELGRAAAAARSAERTPPDAEWIARTRATVDAAVARQMVSDVPLGAFLSGGVDSSIVVSAMSRASSRPVKTFSIGFANESYDELVFAREVAARYATDHEEAVLEPHYLSLVDEVIRHLDQPIADFSVFPTLLVSRIARRHVTVSLAGDGGDELFAGYDAYLADRIARRAFDPLPAPLRRAAAALAARVRESDAKKGLRNSAKRLVAGAALPPGWQHMRWMVFLAPDERRALYTPAWRRGIAEDAADRILAHLDNPGADRLQRQLFCDTSFYLPENILPKVDLMSMAVSLEARVPFLDNEVLDLALAMPSRLKWKGRTRKWVLKQAYADALPPTILAREKQGFSIPLKSWLRAEWQPLMRDLLAPDGLRRDGIFEPATVVRWMDEHASGLRNRSHALWALMVFQLWKRAFLATPGAA